MPNYSLQVTVMPASGLPADAMVNNWSCTATTNGEALLFTNQVVDLYKLYMGMYSNLIAQLDHKIKLFNRADPAPRAPVNEFAFDFASAPSGAPMPTEVALCLSFQGAPESGVSQARKRGRIYFGCFDASSIDSSGRPGATLMAQLDGFGTDLLAASTAAPNWAWVVHSSVTGDNFPVVNGWVDNEFDTQRRRGRLATSRATFP